MNIDRYRWLLTIDELAECLGITPEDVWRSVGEGVMPGPVRLHNGGPRLWSRFQVLRWLEAGCPVVDDHKAELAETEALAAEYEATHGVPLPTVATPEYLDAMRRAVDAE